MKTIEQVKPNVYLQQTKKSWRQVYPVTLDPSKPFGKGNINWKNMLRVNWSTMILIIGIFLISYAYIHDQKVGLKAISILDTSCMQRCGGECFTSYSIINGTILTGNYTNGNFNLNLSLKKDGRQNVS
jgi:hypothetical protein